MGKFSTQIFKVDPFEPELDKIKFAAEILRGGGLVAFPTETVYGLGANYNDKEAVDRIYQVKKRPRAKPLSLHIADREMVFEYASSVPQDAYKLMYRFWPGPLTIILNAKSGGSVGFRFPRNQIAYSLIKEARVPVVAPSANISDQPPPKTANEVLKYLQGDIEVVIDGGKTALGIESTVVDLSKETCQVLREGTITPSAIKKAIETKFILIVCTGNTCRSVMAGELLRRMLKDRDDIEILTAGLSAIPSAGPSSVVSQLMKEQGYDVTNHIARKLTDDLIYMSDIIFAMEGLQKDRIIERVPEAKDKVFLLKEYGQKTPVADPDGMDIPDPIGMPLDFNKHIFDIIKRSIERIAKLL